MYCAGNSWLGRLKKGGRNEEKVEKDKREVGMFAPCEVTRNEKNEKRKSSGRG